MRDWCSDSLSMPVKILSNTRLILLVSVIAGVTCVVNVLVRYSPIKIEVSELKYNPLGALRRLINYKQKCNLELLRNKALESEHFPYDGEWNFKNDGEILHWDTQLCSLDYSGSKYVGRTSTWIRDSNITKILILGDSNGAKYNAAMIDFMKTTLPANCWEIKRENSSENMMPDKDYFTSDTSMASYDIVTHQRDCATCISTLTECYADSLHKHILIEYIAMEYVLDNALTTYRTRTRCKASNLVPCDYSVSYQEFIFREYLRDRYPDVIFFFLNNHDYSRKSYEKTTKDTTYLTELMTTYLPPHTKTLWFSEMGEYEPRKPKMFRNNDSQRLRKYINNAYFQGILSSMKRKHSNSFCFF